MPANAEIPPLAFSPAANGLLAAALFGALAVVSPC
jgi:hypothetical protein